MANSLYGLQDRGDQFVAFAEHYFGEQVAQDISAEVDSVRRPNGTIDSARIPSGRRDGPLQLLGSWLGFSRIGFEVWAEPAFGMFEKRKKAAEAARVLGNAGSDEAVAWVLSNATKQSPSVPRLQSDWDDFVFSGDLDEEFFATEMKRLLLARK